MPKDIKSRLANLGADQLAESLIDLSSKNDDANNLVERLASSAEENLRRYKSRLSAIRRQKRFIDWRKRHEFASELESTLQDLSVSDVDPVTGVKLVADFFRCDDVILGRCDDSTGTIGDIFRFTAADLFMRYASDYEDKPELLKILVDLQHDDGYGVRDMLIQSAGKYLDTRTLRTLADMLWREAEKNADPRSSRHWYGLIEMVARQLKDPEMFEKASCKYWPEVTINSIIEIAKAYFAASNAKTALDRLAQIRPEDLHLGFASDYDDILFKVHRTLNNREESEKVAWRIFRRNRTKDTLNTLLSIIGKDRREEVIDGETKIIMNDRVYSYTDVEFLIACNRVDDAERHVLNIRDTLNGDNYGWLLPVAESFESHDRWLPATVIYRVLMESILRRAISKYYSHGVRYLRKLDKLAAKVVDWKSVTPHGEYSETIRESHARKSSFWRRYDPKREGDCRR